MMELATKRALTIGIGLGTLVLGPILTWRHYFEQGKAFALRDPLRKADAIIVLAGARGNIKYLEGKIATSVRLYQQGWAPKIIMSGRFSVYPIPHPHFIPKEELIDAVHQGRIDESDLDRAASTWDEALGASYMKDQAIKLGICPEVITIENKALHTRENAEFVADILKEEKAKRIILVTSPYHQLRTFLTFAKVLQPYNVEIINYFADDGEWNPYFWFVKQEQRNLVRNEIEKIRIYREKGDLM